MKILLVLYLIGLQLCQEINPIPSTLLYNLPFLAMTRYQDRLYGALVGNLQIFQIDLNTDKLIQNRTINNYILGDFNALRAYNCSLYIGTSININTYFLKLSLSGFQSSFQIVSPYPRVYTFAFLNDFVFVGTDMYVEKYNIKTLQQLDYAKNWGSIDLAIYQQKFIFTGGSYLQLRNCSNLTQLVAQYNVSAPSTYTFTLAIQNQFLFSGHDDASINQWNITSGLLLRPFLSHTDQVYCIVIYGSYLFSGSNDQYLIQWDITTGQVFRKILTGSSVRQLLIYNSFLYLTNGIGLYKYRIPELDIIFLLNETTTATASETIQTSQILISSTSELQQTVQEQTTFEATIKPQLTSEILLTNQTFTLSSSLSTKTTHPALISLLSSSSFDISFFYLIVVVVAVVAIVFGIAVFIYMRNRNQKQKQLTSLETNTTSLTTTKSSLTSSSITSSITTTEMSKMNTISSFTEMNSTLLGTQNAYSIPGHLELKNSDIRIIKQIAKGGQGTVSLAEIVNQDFISQYKTSTVIIKSNGKSFDQLTNRLQNCFNQELAIIHYFKDKPGFVRVFGYTLEPTCFILKYYPLGSMEHLILHRGQFKDFIMTKKFLMFFFREFSNTISLMHDSGFVHCDIKPQNILLEADQQGKFHPILTDFGITQIVSDKVLKVKAMTVENLRGFSVNYAAPEQIEQARIKSLRPMIAEMTKSRDIYAIGGLLFGMMTRKEPWN